MRATRSAARRAEPSFLLAGAVLRRVRWRSDDAEKQRISSQNPLSDGSRTGRPREISRLSFLDATSRRFWSPRHAPVRSWALVLASWGVFGDAPSATRVCRGRLETLPGRSGNALGPLGASRERPQIDFGLILGSPERVVTHLELSTSIYLGVRATPRDPLRSTEAPPPSPTWLDGANSTSRLERSGQPRLDVTSTWLTRSCMAIVDTAYRLADRRTCIAQAATICLHRPPHASSLVIL